MERHPIDQDGLPCFICSEPAETHVRDIVDGVQRWLCDECRRRRSISDDSVRRVVAHALADGEWKGRLRGAVEHLLQIIDEDPGETEERRSTADGRAGLDIRYYVEYPEDPPSEVEADDDEADDGWQAFDDRLVEARNVLSQLSDYLRFVPAAGPRRADAKRALRVRQGVAAMILEAVGIPGEQCARALDIPARTLRRRAAVAREYGICVGRVRDAGKDR